MNILNRIFNSSVGLKFVMALSGCALFLFVTGHMVGNLQVFLPPEAINRYAHFLQSTPELLWPVRLGMLALVALHIYSAVRLTLENRAARPVGYHGDPAPLAASYASRTMFLGGLAVAAFIAYHLLHYTVRVQAINLTGFDFHNLKDPATGHPDVYAMIVLGFRQVPVSLFYIFGVGCLCLHLSHGIQAMAQSLGLRNHAYAPLIARASTLIALVLFLGYASIPVAVLCGHGKDHLQKVTSLAVPGKAL